MNRIIYLFLSLIFLFIFVFPYFAKIKKIVCYSGREACAQEISSGFDNLKGKSFFLIRKDFKNLLDLNNSTYLSSMYFVAPSTMVVRLEEKPVEFYLKSQNTTYFIDGDGKVLSKKNLSSDDVLIETRAYHFNVGDVVPKNVLFSMSVFNYLNYLYRINYARIFEDRLEIKLLSGPLLILPSDGDLDYVVGSVRFLVSQLENNYQIFKLDKTYDNITIDLRYKNPVLK